MNGKRNVTHTQTHTHTHTEEYYSAIKKNEIFATGNNMDGPWGHYAKWNKSDREKYHIISFMYGILKKQTKTQNTKFKDTENKTGGCQRWGSGVDKIGQGSQKVHKLPVIK